MKLSVILPVYNCEKYLDAAILSILKQTYQDFEFIIINDGSSDNSLSIIEDYAKQDQRIKVINQENHGLVYSLNKGIRNAKGEYIARMDGDDISLPDRFAEQMTHLEQHPEVDLISANLSLIDERGHSCAKVINPPKPNLKSDNDFAHAATIFKKSDFLSVGGYRDICKASEDYDLWLRFSEKGCSFFTLQKTLYHYRRHQCNATNNYVNLKLYFIVVQQAHIIRLTKCYDPIEKLIDNNSEISLANILKKEIFPLWVQFRIVRFLLKNLVKRIKKDGELNDEAKRFLQPLMQFGRKYKLPFLNYRFTASYLVVKKYLNGKDT
jgi:glycosyltransferase involved in cell wall biosynthesis